MYAFAVHVVNNPWLATMETPELRLGVFVTGILCALWGVCLMTPIDAPEGE